MTKSQLMEDMKQAMRERNTLKLQTIRFLLAEIKNVEIDQGELSDEAIDKIIARQVKQMEEAIGDLEKSGREELVAEEREKIAVLQAYLPEKLSDEELDTIIDEVMSGMENPQMGQVIGQVMQRVGTQADGGVVSQKVRAKLQ